MRLLPLQINMLHLCGEWLPFVEPDDLGLVVRIDKARRSLVKATAEDFGFDLNAWHTFLTNREDYVWSDKHETIAECIKTALIDPNWQAATRHLSEKNS
ncbi:hypothetical protein [uncultured Gimesia sp.]|uniref:hypothetical protein n=1 Tax=uncultured Gimesia sp. TaxID=1678688 RepID=UPI002607C719|nr:hypothetical protein [uncultured Gimesia sp.]